MALKSYKIYFKLGVKALDVPEGRLLKDVLNEARLDVEFTCGGRGRCGKCRIKILEGASLPAVAEQRLLNADEIQEGIRLACLTKVRNDLTVELPDWSNLQHHILQTTGDTEIKIEPHIEKTFVKLREPSLADPSSDWLRIKESLNQLNLPQDLSDNLPLSILQKLPETIREAQYAVTLVTYGDQLLAIEKGNTTHIMLGMAFDIGTTTIVGYLMDLHAGTELSVVSTLNPQTKFGADVITRTNFVSQQKDGLKQLHRTLIEAVNKLLDEVLQKTGLTKENVYALTIVGNTCMHHLFLGVSPQNIAVSPYVPAISAPLVLNASDINININPMGKVFVLPNIAGFVGADTVAVLLATEMDKDKTIKLAIDIGTNGEIALGSGEKILACSAAAGPAFEGAQISSGMRGAVGAIEHVSFGEGLKYSVIGDVKPQGICGSALLDAVAGLLELGVVDRRGRLIPPEKWTNPASVILKMNVIEHEGSRAFVLVDSSATSHGRPILVTQHDIRELQLAKGAIAAGIKILLEKYGIAVNRVEEVLLAGAFGNYMNPHSACVIGLIPKELESKVRMVGNAAGAGAKQALLSSSEYRRAAAVASFVEFVELGTQPNFTNSFALSSYFEQTI